MRKALLLFSAIFISLTGFSQSDLVINICNAKESSPYETTLTINQLLECGELTANNKNLTVVFFSIAMSIPGDSRKFITSGNKLSEKMIKIIQEHNPSKIYIESIKLSNEDGVIQNAINHTLIIKPQQ